MEEIKDKLTIFILAMLDAFLILFFMIFSAMQSIKYGFNMVNIIEFFALTTLWPIVSKLLALYINQDTNDMKEKVLNNFLHIISGYLVVISIAIVASIFNIPNTILLALSASALILLYLFNGEYRFSFKILNEEEINSKKEI